MDEFIDVYDRAKLNHGLRNILHWSSINTELATVIKTSLETSKDHTDSVLSLSQLYRAKYNVSHINFPYTSP